MENDAVEVVLLRKENEVVSRLRCVGGVQRNGEVASRGHDVGVVLLRRTDCHRWSLSPLEIVGARRRTRRTAGLTSEGIGLGLANPYRCGRGGNRGRSGGRRAGGDSGRRDEGRREVALDQQ